MTEMDKKNIEYVVFEGGGVKGYAYVSAIEELENLGLLTQLKGVAGTSMGAIFAVLLILGFSGEEIRNISYKIDVSEYGKGLYISMLWSIWKSYGTYSLNNLERQFREIIKIHYNPDITLKELYNKTSKELIIVTTCLNQKLPVYLHHSQFPDIKLIDALLSSITVPFGFKPQKYNFLGTQDYYVDGGVVDNYPLWIFNDINALYKGEFTKIDKKIINPHTIGLKVLSEEEEHTHYIYKNRTEINNITEFTKHILDTLLLQNERNGVSNSYLEQTIPITTYGISFFDFSINNDGKKSLIDLGAKSVRKYYGKDST